MTVTIPTVSSIKMRFPEFADVEDSQVAFAIEEASLEVGSNWPIESAANIALVYLAAHYVSCSVARAASGGDGSETQIKSETIGRLSMTYVEDTSKATSEDKDSTSYGRRFLEIMGGSFAGAVIV